MYYNNHMASTNTLASGLLTVESDDLVHLTISTSFSIKDSFYDTFHQVSSTSRLRDLYGINMLQTSESSPGRCAPIPKTIPPMKDLTTENITENVVALNNLCSDPRTRYIFERLVHHLHDFARETQLTSDEWMTGIKFLTAVGQISHDLRAEMILLSDTLGLSLLMDAIAHPRVHGVTEGTVLGPFHTHDAPVTENGYVLHEDPHAERLFVLCSIKDTKGRPLKNVQCDVWEGDSHGFYDVQKGTERQGPDGRAVIRSNDEGVFYFTAIVPVPYPIPDDGPVGGMLKMLNRHPNRPGHIHFMLDAPGYDKLVTALYPRGDPYETSDPVFGVKESLIVDLSHVNPVLAQKFGVKVGMKLLTYDFVLASEDQAMGIREEKRMEAAAKMGLDMSALQLDSDGA